MISLLISYLAYAGAFISISLVFPILIAFGTGDNELGTGLSIYALLMVFFFSSIVLAIRGNKAALNRIGIIIFVLSFWLFVPLIAALPLAGMGKLSPVQAVFETVSAFTTTAADSLSQQADLSPALKIYRSQLQWFGGFSTVLTFVLFLGPIRVGGLPKLSTMVSEAVTKNTGMILRSSWIIARAYLLISIICFAAFMMSGMGAFDSAILMMAAMASGGYLPGEGALMDQIGLDGMAIMVIFLIISATSIFWHQMVIRWKTANLMQHRESYYILAAIFGLGIIIFIVITKTSGNVNASSSFIVLVESLFNAASIVSTSGMESRPGVLALLPAFLIIGIMALGGGSYSTAGGIKMDRLIVLLRQSAYEIRKLIYPHHISNIILNDEKLSVELVKQVWVMAMAALAVIILGAWAFSFSDMDFEAAMISSSALFANAGPAYSSNWAPAGTSGWPDYHSMNNYQMIVASLIMLLGRLEVVTFVALINSYFWAKR